MPLNTRDVNRLLDNATVALPGCLLGALQMELFNVMDDFLRGTMAWKENIDTPIVVANMVVNETEYPIAPSGGQIFRLMGVSDSNGYQRSVDMPEPGMLIFHELPSEDTTWVAVVAKTVSNPVSTATNIPEAPEWILKQYRDGIQHGLIGRMMAMPAKPYTNAKLAEFHLRKFQQIVGQAKADISHNNRYGANTWRFPQVFASSRMSRRW